jgi:hypothetical protein
MNLDRFLNQDGTLNLATIGEASWDEIAALQDEQLARLKAAKTAFENEKAGHLVEQQDA